VKERTALRGRGFTSKLTGEEKTGARKKRDWSHSGNVHKSILKPGGGGGRGKKGEMRDQVRRELKLRGDNLFRLFCGKGSVPEGGGGPHRLKDRSIKGLRL